MFQSVVWSRLFGIIGAFMILSNDFGESTPPARSSPHQSQRTEPTPQFQPPNTGTVSGSGTQKPSQSGSRTFDSDLIALVPASGEGITYSPRPTFWLYYAKAVNSQDPLMVRLTIKDKATNGVTYSFRDIFPLETSPGFFRISLPVSVSPLKIGTQYNWEFIIFSPEDYQLFGKAEGMILRESSSSELSHQLTQASPREKVILYGENGVWYELVDQLACLVSNHPDNLNILNGWKSLLNDDDVRLAQKIDVESPFLASCEPEK